jgi:chromosome segregation ATPase
MTNDVGLARLPVLIVKFHESLPQRRMAMANYSEENAPLVREALSGPEATASAAPPPASPATSNLDDLLKLLLERLNGLEERFNQTNKELKQCRDDRKELENAIGEIKRIIDAYTRAWEGVQKQKDEKSAYLTIKKPMIDATPKMTQDRVREIVGQVDGIIAGLERETRELQTKAAEAKRDFDGAKKDHEDYKQAYLALTLQQKKIEDNFKALTQLKDNIEKEEVNSKLGVMYYLFTYSENGYEKLLDRTLPELWPSDTLKTKLEQSWALLDEAEGRQAEKEEQWQTAQAAVLAKQAELAKKRDEREKDIIDLLRKPPIQAKRLKTE